MTKIIPALLAAFLILAACSGGNASSAAAAGPNAKTYKPFQQVYAFGRAHKVYIGFARLRTDAAGQISDIYIDDMFLPSHWAAVSPEQIEASGLEVVTIKGRHGDEHIAKYIGIGERFFVATAAADNKSVTFAEANQDGSAKSGGIANLSEYFLQSQDNSMEYLNAVETGQMYVMKLDGGQLSSDKATFQASAMNLIKGNSGYWAAYPNVTKSLGFRTNIRLLANYLLLHGFDFDVAKDTKSGDQGVFILDTATGATATDYKDYLNIAKMAEGMLQ